MRIRTSAADDIVFWGLILLTAWAPFPLGSNRPWAMAFLALLSGLLLLCLATGRLIAQKESPPLHRGLRLPLVLAAIPLVWALVQWSTWTPESWHHPIWQQAAAVLGSPLQGRISVNPDATLSTLMNLLGYLAVFWTAMTTTRDPARARLALQIFALIGAGYALYGLAIFFSGAETILFFDKWDYFGSVTSTFVNRNSYATYAGLGLLCAVGLLIEDIRQRLPRQSLPMRRLPALALDIVSRKFVFLVVILLLACALMLTGSRAGIGSTLIALVVLLGISLLRGRRRGRDGLIAAAPLVLVLLATFWLASGPMLDRIDENSPAADRLPAYRLTLHAIQNTPLLGTGYGTFQEVFAAHRDLTVASPSSWKKAHNTYLENMLELGVPAAMALNLAIALIAWRAFRAMPDRRRSRIYLTIGVSATVLVGLHSLVDFSLQIPAISAAYAFIMGVTAAQTFRQASHSPEESNGYS
jgi:O-antigen ligase